MTPMQSILMHTEKRIIRVISDKILKKILQKLSYKYNFNSVEALNLLNVEELLQKVSSKCKSKSKLIKNELDADDVRHSVKTEPQCKYKNNFNSVIRQMIQETPKDAHRKVCKRCHDIGHNIKNVKCKLNIEKNNLLKKKIKKYMLSQDYLSGKTNDEHFVELSKMYKISINMCKTLYKEISPIELCDRMSDINVYVQQIKQMTKINCHQCNKILYNIHINTHCVWKGNNICDSCWCE